MPACFACRVLPPSLAGTVGTIRRPPLGRAGGSFRSDRFHATSRPSAILDMLRCWTTSPSSPQRSAARDSFARGSAAAVRSWRHTRPHSTQRYRRSRTCRIVGRHPRGTCDNRRTTVPPARPARRSRGTSHRRRPAGRPGPPVRVRGVGRSPPTRAHRGSKN